MVAIAIAHQMPFRKIHTHYQVHVVWVQKYPHKVDPKAHIASLYLISEVVGPPLIFSLIL
jgi:hypothetical protein